jgi:asparagine synthase (glutamine-hydrolysing)
VPSDESNGSGEALLLFIEKYIFREAAKPFFTDKIYKKRKHPHSIPLQYPVDGPLHRLMKRLVNEQNMRDLGFLDL